MRPFTALLSVALLSAHAPTSGCVIWPGPPNGHVKGQGEVVKHTLTVADFHGLVLEGSMDVELTPSDTRSVTVEAQANIAELVTTEVSGGIWRVSTREDCSTDKRFIVHISLPTFDRITVRGSGDVKGTGAFRMEDLDVSIDGSGDVTLTVDAKRVTASVGGSGDVLLSGSSGQVKVAVGGSGDVNAKTLRTDKASVSVAGSGDVTVNTSRELDVSLAGSGNVLYRGGPTQVRKSVSGSGVVRDISGSDGRAY